MGKLLLSHRIARFTLVIIYVTTVQIVAGCKGGRSDASKIQTDTPYVRQHCQEDRTRPCRPDCPGEGKFGYCYKEKGHNPKASDINWVCYGIHLGKMCNPCENVYTINFGGAMTQVSCEEFYGYLEYKNKKCGNCLIKQENF